MLKNGLYRIALGIIVAQLSLAAIYGEQGEVKRFGSQNDDCAECETSRRIEMPVSNSALPLNQDLRTKINGFLQGYGAPSTVAQMAVQQPMVPQQPVAATQAVVQSPQAAAAPVNIYRSIDEKYFDSKHIFDRMYWRASSANNVQPGWLPQILQMPAVAYPYRN